MCMQGAIWGCIELMEVCVHMLCMLAVQDPQVPTSPAKRQTTRREPHVHDHNRQQLRAMSER